MWWQWWLTEPKALFFFFFFFLQRNKTEKGELIKLADELKDRVNRQDWITFVMFADSWLPLPLCVSSNYTGTYGSGGEGDESAVKPGHEQSQELKEGANAWTPSHDRQPLGLFYSAARSFLGFVLSALPSHPPTRPPLWMVLQMICVQFGFTRANTASKSRHTLPPSLQSAHLSCVWEAVKPLFYLEWVCLHLSERSL